MIWFARRLYLLATKCPCWQQLKKFNLRLQRDVMWCRTCVVADRPSRLAPLLSISPILFATPPSSIRVVDNLASQSQFLDLSKQNLKLTRSKQAWVSSSSASASSSSSSSWFRFSSARPKSAETQCLSDLLSETACPNIVFLIPEDPSRKLLEAIMFQSDKSLTHWVSMSSRTNNNTWEKKWQLRWESQENIICIGSCCLELIIGIPENEILKTN